MNEERLYQVSAWRFTDRELLEYVIRVPVGKCIFERSEECLERNIGKGNFEMHEIIEIPKCEGCQFDACGQMDHMTHPDGCLHVSSDCDLCQLELRNLIK